MISIADTENWARGGESETLELKRTTDERREAARTICAMLNHRGGRVIFGVEPDGRIIGQMVSDRTVEEVAQDLSEIEPPVLSPSADGLALRDIRKGLGDEIPKWELKNELAALKNLGLVQTTGYARGARWILS